YLNGEKLRLWANRRMDLAQAKRDAKNLAKLKKTQEADTLKATAAGSQKSIKSSGSSK
ncbi:hypothetical protein WICPIJ_005547, partial [Wickerhamomyces pijperi]